MGGGTCLNADNTGRQSFEKCFHAGTAKLPAQHCAPGLVDRMDLKNVFGEIKTYDSNRHLDGSRNVASQLRPTLRHSMPVAAVVHTITSLRKSSACEVSQSTVARGTGEPGRRSRENVALQAQLLGLPPQPGQFLGLSQISGVDGWSG